MLEVRGLKESDIMSYVKSNFLGIENIHVMRDSLLKIFSTLKKKDDDHFFAGIEASGWLRHLRNILHAAVTRLMYVIIILFFWFSIRE